MSDENKPAETKPEVQEVAEPIVRPVGERVVITGGRDYIEPIVRIVPSTYEDAGDNEKAIYISQGKNMGVSLSLPTIQAIIDWALNK